MEAFTQREKDLMAALLLSHDEPFKINYEKFAQYGGYKTAHSANVCFTPLRKKLKAFLQGESIETTPKAPKGGKSRKRVKNEDENNDDEDDATGTPAKKKAKKVAGGKAKGKKASTEEKTTDEVEDEVAVGGEDGAEGEVIVKNEDAGMDMD